MDVFLTSFLYYVVTAHIFLLLIVMLSRKRVNWRVAEYPLIYLPWLSMYGIAHFVFEDPASGIALHAYFIPLLSIVGGILAALSAMLQVIWPKAEIGGFAVSCAGAILMAVIYSKFLALFFMLFVD